MELYRAYIIGDDGRVIGFDKIECRNDDEAIRKASRLVGGERVEVWTGPRLVTVLGSERNAGQKIRGEIDGFSESNRYGADAGGQT